MVQQALAKRVHPSLACLGLLLLTALAAAPVLAADPVPAASAEVSQGREEGLPPSSKAQIGLVAHLRQQGFLFYGAWWCPACFRQKSLFGEQAARQLPYVECDRSDEGRERCSAATIRAFPTWVRGRERREGVLSLDELARWSGWRQQLSSPAPSGETRVRPSHSPML